MAKDYYEILGVSRTASPAEIKQAFRKLAHQHHPDKHGGDEQKFKEINAAYQVLSNPEKRQQYDQFGGAFEQGRGQPGFDFNDFASAFGGGRGGQNFSFDFGDVGDLFGDLFGGGRSRQHGGGRTRVGADIEAVCREAALHALRKDMGVRKITMEDFKEALKRIKNSITSADIKKYVGWAPGPRAAQSLMLAVKARALLQRRGTPSIDDVIDLAHPILKHRMALNYHARADGISLDSLIDTLSRDL